MSQKADRKEVSKSGPVSDSLNFKRAVTALLQVPKDETDAIMEAEKKARSRKRARKAKKA